MWQNITLVEKKFINFFSKDKNHQKARDQCHYTGKYRSAVHSICNLRFNVPNEIPVVFHNGSNYDYHFIIKDLAKESEEQFVCLGENAKKYQTFLVPVEQKIEKVDKDSDENIF